MVTMIKKIASAPFYFDVSKYSMNPDILVDMAD